MSSTRLKGSIIVEGQQIAVSNPDKLLWPEMGITKAIYLQKLAFLAPYLLPYCRNRLLTTIRYPNGVKGDFFYQKNAPSPLPPYVSTITHDDISYIVLHGLPDLLWLGNLAALEFHPSLHYAHSELPCEWMIDLDPSLEIEPRIMEATALVGEVLSSLGIQSTPKTSGATGVQIIIPVEEGITFDDLRKIGHFVGRYVEERHPELFTLERLKKYRGDKIYFDYLQHYAGKTLAAPYTPRARARATVSTPLTWEEVHNNVSPLDFHLLNIEARLMEHGDLLRLIPPQPLQHILHHLKHR
ncbi:DNA polymerase domain-containing protein [Paenibacillus macquariensis subsp. defensor]|nr:DNA polymerase domain-containing protein [Paenibacillus macquariensis subsp. defensor]